MAILNGKPRTATATVVETTRCLVIEAKTLEAMVARNAEIALRLIKKLAKRLDSADTLIEILMHRDPKARVMLALVAPRRGVRRADAKTASASARRADDLAREVGVDVADRATTCMARLRRLRLATEEPGGASSSPTSAACRTSSSSSRCRRSSAGKAERVELRVIGCHGGETPKHRTSAFVLDERLAIDAGSLTSGLELDEQAQARGRASSATRTSITSATSRRSPTTAARSAAPPLIVAGTKRDDPRRCEKHFFNNLLWPDFSAIPTPEQPDHPLPRAQAREAARRSRAAACARCSSITRSRRRAFVIEDAERRRSRTAATPGPTERLWEVLNEQTRTCGAAHGGELPEPRAEARHGERAPHAADARARPQEVPRAARTCRRCSTTSSRSSRPRSRRSARRSRASTSQS